jgi:hypothetical protein
MPATGRSNNSLRNPGEPRWGGENVLHHRDREKHVRIVPHIRNLSIQLSRKPQIVVGYERDEFPLRLGYSLIVGSRYGGRCLMDNARQRERLGDFDRAVL